MSLSCYCSLKKIRFVSTSMFAIDFNAGIYLAGHIVSLGVLFLSARTSDKISLTTFYINTRLSPSAVILE